MTITLHFKVPNFLKELSWKTLNNEGIKDIFRKFKKRSLAD